MPSYASSPFPTPLLDETIGANLERIVRRFPDADAVIDVPTGRSWTYAEFNRDVDDLANGLSFNMRRRRPGRSWSTSILRTGRVSSILL